MLKGFTPLDMDDKLMILPDTPDAQGNTVVHIYRSWGCQEYISLGIKAGNPKETKTKDWATIVRISWNDHFGGMESGEEEVKEFVFPLCRRFLGCHFEGRYPPPTGAPVINEKS
ncbi:hypothetical protein EKO04_004552 [Ascochyta lentis]|uniref:Uncharacterized protein n=1 Tax=Ascochyta lentis TaxID=205686 RepID=A0A8H7J5N2_9PLEO|nr:hypothetical protein EKO04_004552 [Ascochyta lentis]